MLAASSPTRVMEEDSSGREVSDDVFTSPFMIAEDPSWPTLPDGTLEADDPQDNPPSSERSLSSRIAGPTEVPPHGHVFRDHHDTGPILGHDTFHLVLPHRTPSYPFPSHLLI